MDRKRKATTHPVLNRNELCNPVLMTPNYNGHYIIFIYIYRLHTRSSNRFSCYGLKMLAGWERYRRKKAETKLLVILAAIFYLQSSLNCVERKRTYDGIQILSFISRSAFPIFWFSIILKGGNVLIFWQSEHQLEELHG